MSELVKDKTYRRFLDTEPDLPPIATDKSKQSTPPWVVWVQREVDGPWGSKSFWKYSKALKFLDKALRLGVHDAALHCKRVAFKPPTRFARIRGKYITGSDGVQRQATKVVYWKPRMQGGDAEHIWCPYCRRPSVFRYYRRHRALKLPEIDSSIRRCTICGCSETFAKN